MTALALKRFAPIGAATLAVRPRQPQAYSAPSGDDTPHQLGWDHARYGLAPPPECAAPEHPVGRGWWAAGRRFDGRCLVANRHTRAWLALRWQALSDGAAVDLLTVTPNLVKQLQVTHCPVTRQPLGGQGAQAPVILRLNPAGPYSAGNLACVSQQAAMVMADKPSAALQREARHLQWADLADLSEMAGPTHQATPADGRAPVDSSDAARLSAADLRRAWALRAWAQGAESGPQAEAVPLAVLPPNRVRVPQATHALQCLLARHLLQPQGAQVLLALARALPDAVRTNFHLWLGAMLARTLGALQLPAPQQAWALEDAWVDARVQRRWSTWVLSMDEAHLRHWVGHLAELPLLGRCVWHDDEGPQDTSAHSTPTPGTPQPRPTLPSAPVRPIKRRRLTPFSPGVRASLGPQHPARRASRRTPAAPPARAPAAHPSAAR